MFKMMKMIDWGNPVVIGALISGGLALIGTVLTMLFRKSGGNKKQSSILSQNVSQVQGEGDITVDGLPNRKK